MKKKVLVTGAGGLIGSEAVSYFFERGYAVVGIDNNMREYFFGAQGSVLKNIERLKDMFLGFECFPLNIRDEKAIRQLFDVHDFDCIIHTAAQPSHDWAAKEPLTDFTVNANGTLVLLEAARACAPEAPFVFLSTNKVYGDAPNRLPFVEGDRRFEIEKAHSLYEGIDESMSMDGTLHSLFGVSKAAADLLVQEYGRYFGMKTVCFRGGCLTGSAHAGVELHGFLSYLVKSIVRGIPYTVFGYKGKQVRDNIHAFDVCAAIEAFFQNPKSAAVYNIGGTRASNVSVLEAIAKIEAITGKKARVSFKSEPRIGDHKWYISDMSKFKRDYSQWNITKDIDTILEEMCRAEMEG
jgi:CDP-paratose 2-epimerase